jgi:hypothetical protein
MIDLHRKHSQEASPIMANSAAKIKSGLYDFAQNKRKAIGKVMSNELD